MAVMYCPRAEGRSWVMVVTSVTSCEKVRLGDRETGLAVKTLILSCLS